ncbi:MAG: ATP-binding protein [Candidatus Woesearchaeota archaeon]
MNFLLIVCGNSGTGKRTISKHLAQALGAVRIDADEVRRSLGKQDYDPKDAPIVLDALQKKVIEALESQESVIVHSHFRTSQKRQRFYDLGLIYGIAPILIECHCPETIAKERIARRPEKDALHCPPNNPAVYDRVRQGWEDPFDDFIGKNFEVSYLRYNSATSQITVVRTAVALQHSASLLSKIVSLLIDFHPDQEHQ